MPSLLLHNATVIDGTGAGPRSSVSVLVEDGRIARVAPANALKADRDAAVIDCSGPLPPPPASPTSTYSRRRCYNHIDHID